MIQSCKSRFATLLKVATRRLKVATDDLQLCSKLQLSIATLRGCFAVILRLFLAKTRLKKRLFFWQKKAKKKVKLKKADATRSVARHRINLAAEFLGARLFLGAADLLGRLAYDLSH